MIPSTIAERATFRGDELRAHRRLPDAGSPAVAPAFVKEEASLAHDEAIFSSHETGLKQTRVLI